MKILPIAIIKAKSQELLQILGFSVNYLILQTYDYVPHKRTNKNFNFTIFKLFFINLPYLIIYILNQLSFRSRQTRVSI